MIQITIGGDADLPLQAAISQIIQDALEGRGYVCVLDLAFQAAVRQNTVTDYKQAKGQDIYVRKEG